MTIATASDEEQQEIIQMAQAIDQCVAGHRGDLVLSALMSCVMNLAVQMPVHIRPDLCQDVREVADVIEAMGDAQGQEAHALAAAACPAVFTEEEAPTGGPQVH